VYESRVLRRKSGHNKIMYDIMGREHRTHDRHEKSQVLVGTSERTRTIGKSRHRRKDIIKMITN
jgi:hypothetical protein